VRLPDGFDPRQHEGLLAYAQLLRRWNDKVNLVGRRDIANLWTRHIEDALFLYGCLPPIKIAPWLLDVGTGGGLPGMVLAIVDTERNYLLLDRSERKIRFLNQVVAELKLGNVRTLCGDFSQHLELSAAMPVQTSIDEASASADRAIPDEFPAVCARAVAPPDVLWNQVEHLLAPRGELLVACGPQTREQLPPNVDVEWWPDTSSLTEARGAVRLRRCAT